MNVGLTESCFTIKKFSSESFIEEIKRAIKEFYGFEYREKSFLIAVFGVSDYAETDARIKRKVFWIEPDFAFVKFTIKNLLEKMKKWTHSCLEICVRMRRRNKNNRFLPFLDYQQFDAWTENTKISTETSH